MGHVKTDLNSQHADIAAQSGLPGWWPLDWLRSLGRAATIASGVAFDTASKQHPDYRGFRIVTTGHDGNYRAQVTHWQGEAVRVHGPMKHNIDRTRFGSHEDAAQYIRFLIVSGALNHLGLGAKRA